MNQENLANAVNDFYTARRKAVIGEIFARLTGTSNELLSYEEVRKKLKAVEKNRRELKDIPLDAIIGSVGRYSDFTRDFLPRQDSVQSRWANIMVEATGLRGLPPIDVYQIGDVYFVSDGNHRVSVARQLGATHIQANVTEVRSRVPITSDTKPDDLIIKAEFTNFLETTQIDKLRPQADLSVSIPGRYQILEEHISVHQYFMGIDLQRDVSYEEAVAHWFDEVYIPVIQIIRERGVLNNFPNRTETDIYLWLAEYRTDLENSLGWKVETAFAADNLVEKFSSDFGQVLSRITERILDIVIPDPLESGPPVGTWREEQPPRKCDCMFERILVAVNETTTKWNALDQALIFAQKDDAQLLGLHVTQNNKTNSSQIDLLKNEFIARCQIANVAGEFAVENGAVARKICDRAHWADLIIMNLSHPPGNKPLQRLSSGFRTIIRRCSRPILAVPCIITQLDRILLAYTDSPKANEALYISAYLASKWNTHLSIITIDHENQTAEEIQRPAKEYLEKMNVHANYIHRKNGPTADIILENASELESDLILIGGYKAAPVVEVVLGSVVDEVLRKVRLPVLICR